VDDANYQVNFGGGGWSVSPVGLRGIGEGAEKRDLNFIALVGGYRLKV
jgi:hypothetical protein